jgi:hypothetical protein
MSDAWSNVLSAVVGAIIGGAFTSFAGPWYRDRRNRVAKARRRMSRVLLPEFGQAIADYTGNDSESRRRGWAALSELERAAAIAGIREKKAVRKLKRLWATLEAIEDGRRSPAKRAKVRRGLRIQIAELNRYLEAKVDL